MLAVSFALLASAACSATEAKKPQHGSSESPAAATSTTVPSQSPSTAKPAEKIVRAESLAYDNWTVNCAYTDQPAAKPACSAVLRIAEKINNVPRVVFTWIIGHQNSELVSVLSMPTGVKIGPGVEVKFGNQTARKYGYSLCAPNRCEAIIPMDATVVTEMKRAATTQVTIVGMSGQNAQFKVDMKGFERALAAVEK
jgi:invasion protein IalB